MYLKITLVLVLALGVILPNAFAFFPMEQGTIIIQNIQSSTSKQGTYNQTLANNVVINKNGFKINWINGTNNPVNVVNDSKRQQVNVTISTMVPVSGVTSLNALTGALTIACVSGNTTCTSSGGNTITINTAWNVVTTGLSAQTITKQLTLNSLILGGDENANSHKITNLSTPTLSTDAQIANHLGLIGSLVTGLCTNNQILQYQTSNSTWICATASSGTVTSVSGTGNNITSTGGTTPVINLGSDVVTTKGSNQTIAKALTFVAGNTLTTPSNANRAGLNIGTNTADPTTLNNGDCWLNSNNILIKCRIGGNTILFPTTTRANTWTSTQSFQGGMVVVPLTIKTTNFSPSSTDIIVRFNATTGPLNANLPSAATDSGQLVTIIKIDSSVNAVTVNRAGSDTIEGATTKTLSAQYDKITLWSDGTSKWYDLSTGLK